MKWENSLAIISLTYFGLAIIAGLSNAPVYEALMCCLIAAICMGFAGVISAIREIGETKE